MFGRILPTIKYLMEVEVHVYAFSIAANVLLSFFPFLVVMTSICRALNWQAAVKAVFFTIQDYFPADIANIILYTPRSGLQHRQHKFELISVALLLFTANGIFVTVRASHVIAGHVRDGLKHELPGIADGQIYFKPH